jgi:hypothetical protein
MGVKMIVEAVRLKEKGWARFDSNLAQPVEEGLAF